MCGSSGVMIMPNVVKIIELVQKLKWEGTSQHGDIVILLLFFIFGKQCRLKIRKIYFQLP
jgi:hypothetical protein